MSSSSNKLVVALMDGRRLRGFALGFDPTRPLMLYPHEGEKRGFAQQIELMDCKAVYFVRSLQGNKNYRENKTEFRGQRKRGLPMEVVFNDGERMVGTSEAYNPTRQGFFMYPPDPHSNNIRIYVVNTNVLEVRTGADIGRDRKGGAHERILRINKDARASSVADPAKEGEVRRTTTGGPNAPDPRDEQSLSVKDPTKFPGERRVEAVIRILKGEDPDVIAQEVLVPPGILVFWKERFVAAGQAELERKGPDPKDTLIAILRGRINELERSLGHGDDEGL